MCTTLDSQPNAVGSLSSFCHRYGQALPSTLATESQKVVFSLSDEIVAIHTPM